MTGFRRERRSPKASNGIMPSKMLFRRNSKCFEIVGTDNSDSSEEEEHDGNPGE